MLFSFGILTDQHQYLHASAAEGRTSLHPHPTEGGRRANANAARRLFSTMGMNQLIAEGVKPLSSHAQ